MKTAFSALAFALLIYAGLCLLIYVIQRKLIYYPVPESTAEAENFQLLVDNASLRVWYLNGRARDALIYFGGNAEDVTKNIGPFADLFPGRAVYLVHYRGYGGSTGTPTQDKLYSDAVQVFDHLKEQHENIAVIGRSLGSSVAAYLAARRPVDKLVMVTPFDSIADVARSRFPIFPMNLLLRDRFDTARHVQDLKAPALVIIAGQDEIIPRQRADALLAALQGKQVETTVVEMAGHNTLDAYPEYYEALRQFIAE